MEPDDYDYDYDEPDTGNNNNNNSGGDEKTPRSDNFEACVEEGIHYNSNKNNRLTRLNLMHADECKRQCANRQDCTHWTYGKKGTRIAHSWARADPSHRHRRWLFPRHCPAQWQVNVGR